MRRATGDPAAEFCDTEGGGIPEAHGGAQAAGADHAMETEPLTDDQESRPHSVESAVESGKSGPESPWSRAGVPAEALVWPVSTARETGWSSLLGRLRQANPRDGQNFAGIGQENAVPVNLRPWTWEVLPHVSEALDGSTIARLLDRIVWATTHPDDRYAVHAERCRRREESLVARALVRFAATFAGKPSGPPHWLVNDRRRGRR